MISSNAEQRTQFWQSLATIVYEKGTPQEFSIKLREAIINFGSETPDNLNCVDQIRVGEVDSAIGPKFKSSGELLSDIAWSLEDLPMPPKLAVLHPEISQEDWESFARFVTLIFSALNRDIDAPT